MAQAMTKAGTVVRWENMPVGGNQNEQGNEPLLVAMQPGADVPAVEHVEVVVLTENEAGEVTEEVVSQADIQTVVTTDTGQVVAVGAVEEVKEDIEEVVRPSTPSDNTSAYGVEATIEGEDSSPEQSNDSDDDSPPRKKPKPREFSHRLQWRDKDMLEAMKCVSEKKMTIRGAAKKFGVPYSTLKDRIHGRVRHGTKPGVKTALSPEEEEDLVQYINDMEAAGFQLRCIDVRDRAAEILRLNHGHNSPYKDCSPGHNWLAGFLKRHPGLSFKRAINRLGYPPSFQKVKGLIRKFYETTACIYKKHRMTKKGDRVFAVSELHVHVFMECTILTAASANGSLLPPFVVFPGHRQKLNLAREAYPDAFFTNSYNGKVNDEIFLWWFRDHFLKHLSGVPRPCVLFVSRQLNDITFQLVQLAKEERIHLINIPSVTDHLLQPLGPNVADNLEMMLEKKAQKWQQENPGAAFTHQVLAQLLKKVFRKCISSNEIMHQFATTGVYPLNNSAVSNEKITTALRTERLVRRDDSTSSSVDSEVLSGLNLLSALSSHEYASMEHMYNSSGSARTSLGPRGHSPSRSSSSLESTPSRPQAAGRPRTKLEEVMGVTPIQAPTHSSSATSKRKRITEENIMVVSQVEEEEEIDLDTGAPRVKVEHTTDASDIIEEEAVDHIIEEGINEVSAVKAADGSIELTLEVVRDEVVEEKPETPHIKQDTAEEEIVEYVEATAEDKSGILQSVEEIVEMEKVVTENIPSGPSYQIQEEIVTEEMPTMMLETAADGSVQLKPITSKMTYDGSQVIEQVVDGSKVIVTSAAEETPSSVSSQQIVLSDGTTIVTSPRQGFISIPPVDSGSEQVYIQISEEMIQNLVQGSS